MNKESSGADKLWAIVATAGAAIGLGNLWKFPYSDGAQRRSLAFLPYLLFLSVYWAYRS